MSVSIPTTAGYVIRVDPRYYRPTEVDQLLGDAKKAREKLGWVPGVDFKNLVRIMVEADWGKARRLAEGGDEDE